MSMNIVITAEGEVTTPVGRKMSVCHFFNVNQTPTTVTYAILDSADPIQAYKDWIMEREKDEIEEIHDIDQWDEKTHYYKVVGTKIVNWCKNHCDELDEFIKKWEELGFKIEVSLI